MEVLIPIVVIALILVVGVVLLRQRPSSGRSGGNSGSNGRPGADKH